MTRHLTYRGIHKDATWYDHQKQNEIKTYFHKSPY